MAAKDQEILVEEAMPWLNPTQILHQAACHIKVELNQVHFCCDHQPYHLIHRQRRHDRSMLSPSDFALSPNQKSKYQRQKSASPAANRTAGGPGMQAIFLDSGRKLGGTGVFLPRRTGGGGGGGYQPNNKPACSMILVPARVVQALNLDVQALRFQIPPRKDPKGNQKGRECNLIVKNKKGKDVTSTHCSFMSHNQTNSSQEIFLPKEWTY